MAQDLAFSLCVHVYDMYGTYVPTYGGTCMWRAEEDIGCLGLSFFTLSPLDMVSHCPWSKAGSCLLPLSPSPGATGL